MENADIRVVDGDDVEFQGQRFRLAGYDAPEITNFRSRIDKGLERRRGYQAALRLQTLIGGARSVYIIPWGTAVFPNRQLATLLIDGWDVATIAQKEGWGIDYRSRKSTDWGDARQPFPDSPPPQASASADNREQLRPGDLEVIDGDTVSRDDGQGGREEFRLLGFDTPEVKLRESKRGKIIRGELHKQRGLKAAAILSKLLAEARTVELEPGVGEDGNRMHRGRRFAHLYINGQNVKDIAIKQEWGVRYPYEGGQPPNWDDPDYPFPDDLARQ